MALKNIYQKLNKDPERIELGAIDDIEKDWKELNKLMDDASKIASKLSQYKGKGRTLANRISKDGKEAIQKLEDLGLNADAGFVRSMVAYANNSLKTIQQNFPF